jgi:hypothetical protein
MANTIAAIMLKNTVHKMSIIKPNQTLNDVMPQPRHATSRIAMLEYVIGDKFDRAFSHPGILSIGHIIPLIKINGNIWPIVNCKAFKEKIATTRSEEHHAQNKVFYTFDFIVRN